MSSQASDLQGIWGGLGKDLGRWWHSPFEGQPGQRGKRGYDKVVEGLIVKDFE